MHHISQTPLGREAELAQPTSHGYRRGDRFLHSAHIHQQECGQARQRPRSTFLTRQYITLLGPRLK